MGTYEFKKATLSIVDDNIVLIRVKDNAEIDSHDALEIFTKRKELTGDKKYAVVLVHGKHSAVTTEARKLAAEPEYALYREAFAIVVQSLAQRFIGNFYIKFDKPPSPTHLFTDEKRAIEWVKSFKGVGKKEMSIL